MVIDDDPIINHHARSNMLIKFTNCKLAIDGILLEKNLWIDSTKGVIVDSQKIFPNELALLD